MSESSSLLPLDYLEFSELAYDLTSSTGLATVPIPSGFSVLTSAQTILASKSYASGMTAVAFINGSTHQIVISFRGSVALYNDWIVADIENIKAGTTPQAFLDALNFAQAVEAANPGNTFYVTGHSLGGAEAEYVGAALSIGGDTFAAPGVPLPISTNSTSSAPVMIDFVNQYDPIGNYAIDTTLFTNYPLSPSNFHYGQVKELSDPVIYSSLYDSGKLGLGISAALFHPLGAYGTALLNAGYITVDPIGQSQQEPIDLATIYPEIQDVTSGSDANGYFTQTGTVIASTSSGFVTMLVEEISTPTGVNTFITSVQSGSSKVSQTDTINVQGVLTLDSTTVNGLTIQSSTANPAGINVSSSGAILIGIPAQQQGDEVTVVANTDGSDAVMVGGDSSSTAQTVVDFADNGTMGDVLNFSNTTSGVVDLTATLGAGDKAEISSDASLADVAQDFDFSGASGTLELDNPGSFVGTIYSFQPGDTIDLAGIGTATGAALGANNVLTLAESGGGTVTLDLDPTQDFSDDSFLIAPDGSGGTNVVAEADSGAIAFTGTGEVLLVPDPANVSGTISNFLPGDAIDLAGVLITGVTQKATGLGAELTLQEDGGGTLSFNVAGPGEFQYSQPKVVAYPDGNDGTDLTLTDAVPAVTAPDEIGPVEDGTSVSLAGIQLTTDRQAAINETFTLTLSDISGILSATAAAGGTVSGSDSTTLTLTGDLSAITDELASVLYTANLGTSDVIAVDSSNDEGVGDQHEINVSTIENGGEVLSASNPNKSGSLLIGSSESVTVESGYSFSVSDLISRVPGQSYDYQPIRLNYPDILIEDGAAITVSGASSYPNQSDLDALIYGELQFVLPGGEGTSSIFGGNINFDIYNTPFAFYAFSGYGTVDGFNSSLAYYTASGGTLNIINSPFSEDESIVIDGSSKLTLDAASVAVDQQNAGDEELSITFSGSNATLSVPNLLSLDAFYSSYIPEAFELLGFQPSDVIDFTAVQANRIVYLSYQDAGIGLQYGQSNWELENVSDGAVTNLGTLTLSEESDNSTNLYVESDGSGGTLVLDSVACYLAGTRIAMPHGETPVESLAIGDLVLTHAGALRPIKWIGHRTIDCRRHPRPQDVWPVRIRADAFGRGLPCRDLWLSPDHAIFVDGVLIPVKHLINHATIVQQERDEVTYYHIELERHDVILAEGLPCESYLDNGTRSAFANGGSVVQLHPEFAPAERCEAISEAAACAPLCIEGEAVARVKARLRRRAVKLGHRLAKPVSKKSRQPASRVTVAIDLAALLDPAWYLAHNPDVAAAEIDAVTHYADFGRLEGRLPCPEPEMIRALGLIEPATVIRTMPDVVAAGADVVEHFCTYGWRERRRPNAYFDTGWYLDTHDVPAGMNPLLHYVLLGENQGLAPSRHFDSIWYRQRYVIPPSVSALAHYLQHRRIHQLSPLPSFDLASYTEAHKATLRPNRDPYAHYLAIGRFSVGDEDRAVA